MNSRVWLRCKKTILAILTSLLIRKNIGQLKSTQRVICGEQRTYNRCFWGFLDQDTTCTIYPVGVDVVYNLGGCVDFGLITYQFENEVGGLRHWYSIYADGYETELVRRA